MHRHDRLHYIWAVLNDAGEYRPTVPRAASCARGRRPVWYDLSGTEMMKFAASINVMQLTLGRATALSNVSSVKQRVLLQLWSRGVMPAMAEMSACAMRFGRRLRNVFGSGNGIKMYAARMPPRFEDAMPSTPRHQGYRWYCRACATAHSPTKASRQTPVTMFRRKRVE